MARRSPSPAPARTIARFHHPCTPHRVQSGCPRCPRFSDASNLDGSRRGGAARAVASAAPSRRRALVHGGLPILVARAPAEQRREAPRAPRRRGCRDGIVVASQEFPRSRFPQGGCSSPGARVTVWAPGSFSSEYRVERMAARPAGMPGSRRMQDPTIGRQRCADRAVFSNAGRCAGIGGQARHGIGGHGVNHASGLPAQCLDDHGHELAGLLPGVVFEVDVRAVHRASFMREGPRPCLRRGIRKFFAGAAT